MLPAFRERRTLTRVELNSVFEEAATRRVFPGGVVFCARENITLHQAFGTTAYDAEYSRPVELGTIYDLASLSKLFTLTAFLIAKRAANISENAALAHFLPQFDRDDKRAITLRHLMMHSAGFGFALQRLQSEPCENWIEKIAAAPLESAPGERVNYTCTAYFLLARVVEKICGQPIDEWLQNKLLAPLKINSSFAPLKNYALNQIAPTELKNDGTPRQTPWHGVVHDEAARQWREETGTFCGNAGVFGTAENLARFCQMWLNNGEEILHPDDVEMAFADVQIENAEGGVYRGWGWQRDNKTYSGEKAPPHCFGHQGFTGPTLFLNSHTKDLVIVLNNRVYPTRNGPARFVYHRRVANAHFALVEKEG